MRTSGSCPSRKHIRGKLDSKVADIRSTAGGDRAGGALVAAAFLREFVGEGIAWAHLDIAGPAWTRRRGSGYVSPGGTGFGVRTLVALAALAGGLSRARPVGSAAVSVTRRLSRHQARSGVPCAVTSTAFATSGPLGCAVFRHSTESAARATPASTGTAGDSERERPSECELPQRRSGCFLLRVL